MKRQRDYSDDYHLLLSQFPREEVDAARNYVKILKTRFQYGQPEEKLCSSFSSILKDAMDTKAGHDGSVVRQKVIPEIFSARVKAILEGNLNLICGFNSLMPPSYQISVHNEEKKETEAAMESKTIEVREAMDFVKKIGSKCGQHGCEEFLNNFRLYKEGYRNLVDVFDIGLTLTEGHPDLQKEFIKFMPLSELQKPLPHHLPDLLSSDLTSTRVDEPHKKSQEANIVKADGAKVEGSDSIAEIKREGLGFLEKVKKRLSCNVSYKTFLKLFVYYTKGKFGKEELEKMVADLIGKYPDLIDEFYKFWRSCESVNVHEVRGHEEKDRRRQKKMNESRRQDCSFKRRNPNQSKKNWFEYEDELYHLDMTVEWFKSAVVYAEELGGSIVKNEGTTGSQRIFLRCIEHLYGDQGIEVLDIFHKDPQRALPVIRKRLQQKLIELIQYRQSFKWY